jgi:DNA-binding response OmpR family regulator
MSLSIAVIDNDREFLKSVKKIYTKTGAYVKTYRYNGNVNGFNRTARKFDIIVVNYKLAGCNGANIVSCLLKSGFDGTIIIIADELDKRYENFQYYVTKSEVMEHPDHILHKEGDIVEQAVEASVLLQKVV